LFGSIGSRRPSRIHGYFRHERPNRSPKVTAISTALVGLSRTYASPSACQLLAFDLASVQALSAVPIISLALPCAATRRLEAHLLFVLRPGGDLLLLRPLLLLNCRLLKVNYLCRSLLLLRHSDLVHNIALRQIVASRNFIRCAHYSLGNDFLDVPIKFSALRKHRRTSKRCCIKPR
jgi:hypothetical protein